MFNVGRSMFNVPLTAMIPRTTKPVHEQLECSDGTEWVSCKRIRGDDFGCIWHFHPELEITLVLSGGSCRRVGDKIENLHEGDLTFLGSNLPHDYRNDRIPGTRFRPVDALNIQFHPDFMGTRWSSQGDTAPLQRLLHQAADGFRILGPTRDRIQAAMLKMTGVSSLRRMILLLEILEDLSTSPDLETISSYGFTPEVVHSDGETMSAICNFIQDHIGSPIYLSDIARHLRMSEITFSRYFRSRTGKTFPTYLNEIRISRVCRLLAETDKPVGEIAWDCGFDSIANFQRQFKRIQGCTPKAYRHRIAGLHAPAAGPVGTVLLNP